MRVVTRALVALVLVTFTIGSVPPAAHAREHGGPPPIATLPAASMSTTRNGHTATLLQSGTVLVAGGEGGTEHALASAETYDAATNAWTAVASMSSARRLHTATPLRSGKVLVVGGLGPSDALAAAELYDPASNAWSSAGSMNEARFSHTATLLPSGKVLVAGGRNAIFGMATAELYDPATNAWSSADSMSSARSQHTATLLPSGRVLVAGGFSDHYLAEAEIYDAAADSWASAAPMSEPRALHSATLLPSGKVLVVAGYAGVPNITSVESYDPASDSWSPAASLSSTHFIHTATLLPSGKLLVAGGGGEGGIHSSVRVYDPVADSWSFEGVMPDGRIHHTATLLPSGRVLLAGVYGTFDHSSAELYDAGEGSWSAASSMERARGSQTATVLPSGNVLVAGGWNDDALAGAEIYDVAANAWTTTSSMLEARRRHTATLLASGRVLVAGGLGKKYQIMTAELFDPTSASWSSAGALAEARSQHTATLLASGEVLVAGGADEDGQSLASVEVYDPATGSWSPAAPMISPRSRHTATLLADGRVLVGGGWDGGPLLGVEIYDPATDTWSQADSMQDTRAGHTATILPSGKVLIVAGEGSTGPSVTAEVFDPSTNDWTYPSFLGEARTSHAATLLPSGEVLVAGGMNVAGKARASVEVYDPLTNAWSSADPLSTERAAASATLLPSGRVLVAGGDASGAQSSAELYDEGRGFSDAWRPVVQSTSSPTFLGGELSMIGSGFTGLSEASSGSGTMSSPTNHPVLHLTNLDSGRTTFAPLASGSVWTDQSFTSQVPVGFVPGYALATVYVNGIPGVSKVVQIVGLETPPCAPSAVQFTAASLTVTEGGSAILTITRSQGCDEAFSVTCAPVANTAGFSDYSQHAAIIDFAPDQTTAEFPVSALGDDEVEGVESFFVRLAVRSGDVELGPRSVAIVTIDDDDVAGTFEFVESNYPRRGSLVEGGTVDVVVRRQGGAGTATVRWNAVNGTATGGAPQDFDGPGGLSGVLVFGDDDRSKTVTFSTRNDSLAEGSESFSVTLATVSPGGILGPVRRTVVTIDDDDVPPDTSGTETTDGDRQTRFFFGNAVYTVDESSAVATVTVGRSNVLNAESVRIFTTNASATAPQDYTQMTSTLVQFPAGIANMRVTIAMAPDSGNADEGFEHFNVRLDNASAGARLGHRRRAVVIVEDRDMAGSVEFSSAVYEAGESGGALTVTLSRSGGTAGAVSVRCTSAGGSATAGVDFVAVNALVSFADGETTASFAIPILDDQSNEGNELVNLTLSQPTGGAATGDRHLAVVTIEEDE
jgi:N-acetylneuraminic acid mutarotase